MDLLRWWRFLHGCGCGVGSCLSGRCARFQLLDPVDGEGTTRNQWCRPAPSRLLLLRRPANPVTGKPALGTGYSPATVAHSETVLRSFSTIFIGDAGTGPLLNPFPLDLSRRSRRAHAHHNPMDHWAPERGGTLTGLGSRSGFPERFPRICSISCSRHCRRIGTGRWWRSGFRRGCERRSCWESASAMSTRGSS